MSRTFEYYDCEFDLNKTRAKVCAPRGLPKDSEKDGRKSEILKQEKIWSIINSGT